MDSHAVQLLVNLYWKEKRCVVSPDMFAMNTEMIMISLEDKGHFRIGGRVFSNIRYADDTVILAETEHELQ